MEFLRPRMNKVVLFSVIFLISIMFVYIYSIRHTLICTSTGCPSVEKVARNTALNSIIPMIIISYLLSCLIVLIIERIRYKNKKPFEKYEKKEFELEKIKGLIDKVKKKFEKKKRKKLKRFTRKEVMAEISKSGIMPSKK